MFTGFSRKERSPQQFPVTTYSIASTIIHESPVEKDKVLAKNDNIVKKVKPAILEKNIEIKDIQHQLGIYLGVVCMRALKQKNSLCHTKLLYCTVLSQQATLRDWQIVDKVSRVSRVPSAVALHIFPDVCCFNVSNKSYQRKSQSSTARGWISSKKAQARRGGLSLAPVARAHTRTGSFYTREQENSYRSMFEFLVF